MRAVAAVVFVMLVAAAAPAAQAAVSPPWDPFFANQQTVADFGSGTRPFGVATGDFNNDHKADAVVGRVTGNVHFVKGNGDGTFAAPTQFTWKQTTFNAWAFTSADVNGDGNLDVVWGANATSTGCSVSPIPSTGCPSTVTVNDGDVRVFYGNGTGAFAENTYFVSGVRHNAGQLLGNVGSADAGSLATGDVDSDGDSDIVVGGIDGSNAVVKLLRNGGGGTFTSETLISQTAGTSGGAPAYFPPTPAAAQNSPWGLSLADADGDGDRDLWVGDRALYVYLYENGGSGAFTLHGNNLAVTGRPNAYLGHDGSRAAVGFTPSLASGDLNGDGKADLVLGLQSGTQTPASNTAHDGEILLDVSRGGGHDGNGPLADVGAQARGIQVADFTGDGYGDVLSAEYDGKLKLLRQLTPRDDDGDGISDYVDNAPADANAPRLDMNADGSLNFLDQLDNDFDTVLGNPEDESTWQRLGDPADTDDDNDGVGDGADDCVYAADASQGDADGDGAGDACDPLDDRDADGDGVPTGPSQGDPYFAESHAAKVKWSEAHTHFVIRIDALGRLFQNEFTSLLTDAATLSPADFAAKCGAGYGAGDPPNPCAGGALDGGREVPVSLVVIPKQLWSDTEVIDWINDRNDNPRLEIGQHGTYHVDNTGVGDWKDMADRNFFSCEPCGLTNAENAELMKIGKDTLLGHYDNKWMRDSGATASSPKIDWATSANPLISFAPPFNTSDPAGRRAVAELGYKSFSASVFEEGESGTYGPIFTPEGSHHERFDQYGMFHASADVELDPPAISGGSYDRAAFEQELEDQTDDGGLTTWLIEEVEWSGRPCNEDPRLGTCNGGSNRENNTVYAPRWEAWLQLLDYVKNRPDTVAMTLGEVALAKGYDNAPTVDNPGQADADHDAIGDVIEGVTVDASHATLARNVEGALGATVRNGAGDPLADQEVEFKFDADGDGSDETYTATTDADGVARADVTATRPVGTASFTARWDGGRGVTASGGSAVDVTDATTMTLSSASPASGQVTDAVTVGARLADSDGNAVAGRTVRFSIDGANAVATTDASGDASAQITLPGPAQSTTLRAAFDGDTAYAASSDSRSFAILREDTKMTLANAITSRGKTTATAVLRENDNAPLGGRTIRFYSDDRGTWTLVDTAVTAANGSATGDIPAKYVSKKPGAIRAVFDGDPSFLPSSADATASR